MGSENWMKYVPENVKGLQVVVENFWGSMGSENLMKYVPEKAKGLPVVLKNLWGSLMGKVDEVFPPGTRVEQLLQWFRVAKPFLIAGAVVLLLFICRCRSCGGKGRKPFKTMKAPGRDYRMPRHTFESNPRSYFRDLRGK